MCLYFYYNVSDLYTRRLFSEYTTILKYRKQLCPEFLVSRTFLGTRETTVVFIVT